MDGSAPSAGQFSPAPFNVEASKFPFRDDKSLGGQVTMVGHQNGISHENLRSAPLCRKCLPYGLNPVNFAALHTNYTHGLCNMQQGHMCATK
jgi:hypothetical protein